MEVKSDVSNLYNNLYDFLGWLSSYIKPAYHKDVLIIGSGWYGCHLATQLKERGMTFDMLDKANAICTGSSLKNQNRLHLGFHYPRSAKTRKECKKGYSSFIERYPTVLNKVDNFYLTSSLSLLDNDTFCGIYEHEKTSFEYADWSEVKPFEFNRDLIDGLPVRVQEQMINPVKVQLMFQKELEKQQIEFDLTKPNNNRYKHVMDCTYGRLISPENFCSEKCITFVIRMKRQRSPIAITIIDGPFFSIYPYDVEEQLYTLTHVTYTPTMVHQHNDGDVLRIYHRICEDVRKYIHNYDDIFEYSTYYVSFKTKLVNAKSDDRSMVYNKTGKIHSFMGGKITGIFEMDAYIDRII
jgi:hypothetical protein